MNTRNYTRKKTQSTSWSDIAIPTIVIGLIIIGLSTYKIFHDKSLFNAGVAINQVYPVTNTGVFQPIHVNSIKLKSIDDTTATIEWDTREPVIATILYGNNEHDLEFELSADTMSTHGDLVIPLTFSSRIYYFQLVFLDANNNEQRSTVYNFNTYR